MDQSKEIARVFNKYAGLYHGNFSSLDLYHDTYEMFLGLLEKEKAKILEIGCSPGNITHYLLTKQPGLDILGIDLAGEMLAVASAYNPRAHFRKMDCRDIGSLNEKFDAVVCGFCLPYLSQQDCLKLISDTADLLNEKGLAYFSTIEGNYENSGYETSGNGQDRLFVYYYDKKFLAAGLKSANFDVEYIVRKNYEKTDGTLATHLVIIAVKK